MNVYPKLISVGVAALGLAAASLHAAPLRILYFSKSSGFEHSVVKQAEGQPSYSERVLSQIASANELEFTFTKDGSKFTSEYLAGFDAVLFYTSGDLLSVGTDGHPAMTLAGKRALLEFVSNGKGFVGVHSCSDSFHTGECGGGNPSERGRRFQNYGEAADPFIRCLGGEFIRHGPQQVAAARVVSPGFPGFEKLGREVRVMEEWYTLKEFAPNLHVLLIMETQGMEGSDYQRPPFPLAWARQHNKGRVAYNAMGHREDVWDSEAFQSMLVGMLKWAGGAARADVTPNLEQVTPQHATIQPLPPPKP